MELLVFDAIAVPGRETTLNAKAGIPYLFLKPYRRRYRVAYSIDGVKAGEMQTGRDGYARFRHTFDRPGIYSVSVRTLDAKGDGDEGWAHAFCSDRNRPGVIVDIDHTITNISLFGLLFLKNTRIHPLEGAPGALREISQWYDIIFLTRREDILLQKTRQWLSLYGFPAAPIYLWDFWSEPLRARAYKTAAIRLLKEQWPSIEIGIGDKNSDVRAYRANGLEAVRIVRGGRHPGVAEAKDWNEVKEFLRQRREETEKRGQHGNAGM